MISVGVQISIPTGNPSLISRLLILLLVTSVCLHSHFTVCMTSYWGRLHGNSDHNMTWTRGRASEFILIIDEALTN